MSTLKKLLPLILIAGSSTSYALSGNYDIDAYAGAETKIRRMEFKNHFGSRVFKDPFYTQLSVFLGCKLNKYFGVEAGYELSDTKLNSRFKKNGSMLFGCRLLDSVPGFDSVNNFFNAKTKIDGFNINFVGYVPANIKQNVHLIGSVGLGYLKSRTVCDLFEIGETNITLGDGTLTRAQRVSRTSSKYKNRVVTVRINSGIQYMSERNFGFRALIGWENTHKIKIRGKDHYSSVKLNEYAKFKDSISYRVGFFVPF